ncbi:MAG: hypothetical protein IJE10_01940 [Clostridia bacterium]|nr:hypothetical protein [Clostridia bacterium]
MRIFCDADDVLINTVECWVELINRTYNQNVKPEAVTDWDATVAYPMLTAEQVYGVLNADTLWHMVSPLPGSVEYLKKLIDDGHEVYITTASDYHTATTKILNLLKMFPYLTERHIIIIKNKQILQGGIMIDDGIHNLEGGNYQKILFTKPHNASYDAEKNGMIRVHAWEEIYDIICKLSKQKN